MRISLFAVGVSLFASAAFKATNALKLSAPIDFDQASELTQNEFA